VFLLREYFAAVVSSRYFMSTTPSLICIVIALDLVAFDFRIQSRVLNAEQPGGPRLIPAASL
jgi:hypothetical protein